MIHPDVILTAEEEAWGLLKQFLQRFVPVTNAEFAAWKPYFEIRRFDKKHVVVEAGEQEDYINIVASGLARKYMRQEHGEVTMQIAPEGHMIHSEMSFHNRTPSRVVVETIEPTMFVSVSYDNLETLYDKFPKMEQLGRLFVTEMFIIKDRRYFEMLNKSTRQIFYNHIT